LPSGNAANAATVIGLTVGHRHPGPGGEPLIEASEHSHPGFSQSEKASVPASL